MGKVFYYKVGLVCIKDHHNLKQVKIQEKLANRKFKESAPVVEKPSDFPLSPSPHT